MTAKVIVLAKAQGVTGATKKIPRRVKFTQRLHKKMKFPRATDQKKTKKGRIIENLPSQVTRSTWRRELAERPAKRHNFQGGRSKVSREWGVSNQRLEKIQTSKCNLVKL